jgi:hypothetical protein
MLRYCLTRIALLAGIVGLVVATEWLVTELLGIRRTQLTFLATAGALTVLARWPLRSSIGDWFGGIWRAHLHWAESRPWWASAADGVMVFVVCLPVLVIDGYGFLYSAWNVAVCASIIGGLGAVSVLMSQRRRKAEAHRSDAPLGRHS